LSRPVSPRRQPGYCVLVSIWRSEQGTSRGEGKLSKTALTSRPCQGIRIARAASSKLTRSRHYSKATRRPRLRDGRRQSESTAKRSTPWLARSASRLPAGHWRAIPAFQRRLGGSHSSGSVRLGRFLSGLARSVHFFLSSLNSTV